MENRVNFFIYSICLFLSFFFLSSCDETAVEQDIELIASSGEANFVVANITTGEQVKNMDKQDNPNRLVVHNGDVLDLSYIPEEVNEQYSRKVSFELFGQKVTANNSYTAQYSVEGKTKGKYTITCISEMERSVSDGKSLVLKEVGYAYIEIVEN